MIEYTFGPPITWTYTPRGRGRGTVIMIPRGPGYHFLLPWQEYRIYRGIRWHKACLN